MVQVMKRSGSMENFDPSKLEASMKSAGAQGEEASRVVKNIASNVKDGMKTDELTMMTASELKRVNPMAAEKYANFKKR